MPSMPSVPSPGVLRGLIPGKKASVASLNVATEPHHLEDAMQGMLRTRFRARQVPG